MTLPFGPPDAVLAARVLRAVPFRDRLPAGRFKPPVGIVPGDIRSLSALFLHLSPQPDSLPGVNLGRLPDWIERAVGDETLAAAVREAVRASTSHVEGCLRVYDLVALRLAQAHAVAEQGSADQSTDPAIER